MGGLGGCGAAGKERGTQGRGWVRGRRPGAEGRGRSAPQPSGELPGPQRCVCTRGGSRRILPARRAPPAAAPGPWSVPRAGSYLGAPGSQLQSGRRAGAGSFGCRWLRLPGPSLPRPRGRGWRSGRRRGTGRRGKGARGGGGRGRGEEGEERRAPAASGTANPQRAQAPLSCVVLPPAHTPRPQRPPIEPWGDPCLCPQPGQQPASPPPPTPAHTHPRPMCWGGGMDAC